MYHKDQVKTLTEVLIALSWLAAIIGVYGFIGETDLWLATTQWLIVSAILALNAIYFLVSHKK